MIPYPNGRADWDDALVRQAGRDKDLALNLSLINVRQISGLSDIQAFAPQSPEDVKKQEQDAINRMSQQNLLPLHGRTEGWSCSPD